MSMTVQDPVHHNITVHTSLAEIADRIRRVQNDNIIQIGDLLLIAKSKMAHGNFQSWAERELGIKARTAQNYMNAAEFVKDKNATVSHLPPSILYQLAAPSAPRAIVDKVINADVIDADAIDSELERYRQEQRKPKLVTNKSIEEKRRLQRIKRESEKAERERAEKEAKMKEELAPVIDLIRGAGLIEPLAKVFQNYSKAELLGRMIRGLV